MRKFAAVLHPKLAAFTPLSLAAGPAQLLTKNTMEKTSRRKMLQTAVQADPTNLDAHAALEAYADELSSSFATEVESRLSADSIKVCIWFFYKVTFILSTGDIFLKTTTTKTHFNNAPSQHSLIDLY